MSMVFRAAHTRVPIGVLIPTYNCISRLQRHLDDLNTWIHSVREVVVVDSHSDDGTYELIKKGIKHPEVRIYQHPRGLYQSWNFGIEKIRSEWTYISTVGDWIDEAGLLTMTSFGLSDQLDVVISPPNFEAPDGRHIKKKKWPVHQMLKEGLYRADDRISVHILNPWQVFLRSALNAPQGMLGSSASNVYRTECLKKNPFPTDYGHFGDTAWAIQHAFDVRAGILPKPFSTFLLHDSGVATPGDKLEEMRDRLFDLAIQTLSKVANDRTSPELETITPLVHSYVAGFHQFRNLDKDYSGLRRNGMPWIFNPVAWATRTRRNHQRRRNGRTMARLLSLPEVRRKPEAAV